MADFSSIIEAAKKAALSAVESSKPSGVYFGTVINSRPLKINVEQKLTLESAQLILVRNVTDYNVEMTVAEEQQVVTVHNGLVNGDRVILLRVQGGQKYVVFDRIS